MAAIANGDFGLSARLKLNKLLSLGANVRTGPSYTLIPEDESKMVLFNHTSSVNVVVPLNLGQGFVCRIARLGTGIVILVGASGVILSSMTGEPRLTRQYAVAELLAYGTDAFLFSETSILVGAGA